MCVCSCVCVFCTCAYMCVRVRLCVHVVCVRASMCVMSCVRASVCTCVCTFASVCICVCVCVCACVCTCGVHCVCMCVCVCVCACMWCVCVCVSVCVHVCVWCVCVHVSACTHSNPTHVFWSTVLQKPFAPWTPRRNPQSVPKSAVQVLLHESKKQVKHNNKISSLCQNLLSRCYLMNLKNRWNTTMKSLVCPKICCPVVTLWIWNTRVTVVGGVGGGAIMAWLGYPLVLSKGTPEGKWDQRLGSPQKRAGPEACGQWAGVLPPSPPPR